MLDCKGFQFKLVKRIHKITQKNAHQPHKTCEKSKRTKMQEFETD